LCLYYETSKNYHLEKSNKNIIAEMIVEY
jgi:hypothetical protein